MTTGTLHHSNLATVVVPRLSRSLEMSSLSVQFMHRAGNVDWARTRSMDWPPDAVIEGRAFKGVCWALAIEGAAAICIYGLWQLWSLIR
ncbi:MAG: hypothetical protein WAL75_25785 [Terracidiphilus sp.]